MCGKTKGLESFAKSQRRNPDTAKCFACVEGQLANEAFDEDKYEDPDKAFVTPDHSNGQYPEYFTAATSDTSSSYVCIEFGLVIPRVVAFPSGCALTLPGR